MTRSRRTRPSPARSTAAVLSAGALTVALSACGASLDAQTYQERVQASSTNTAVGTLAVRGLQILPPDGDRMYEAGEDALASVVIVNEDDEPDTLVEVTSEAAESVEIVAGEEPGELEIPALGTTGTVELRLTGLTEDLREGEFVPMTLRFARSGTLEVLVPVAISDVSDRPVFTGDDEHEPALQYPAGGHGEEGGEFGESASETQPERGVVEGS